jgi:hypothetical protein
MPEQTSLQLGPNAVDYRVAIYKGILGSVPFLGGLLAEVVGAVIPEQQNDRLRQFVEALEAKIQDLDPEQVEARFQEPEFIDLLQESLTQSVRAVAQERIEHIAEIVHQSLSDQDRRYIHFKKLLYILQELNDLEVLMLCSYGRRQDNDFWAAARRYYSSRKTCYGMHPRRHGQLLSSRSSPRSPRASPSPPTPVPKAQERTTPRN